MAVEQGEIYWLDFGDPVGSEPGFRRPVVIVQNNAVNRSGIGTAVVAAVTTNLRLAAAPGNVFVLRGEGGLSRDSVVNVSQLNTVDVRDLEERLGKLSAARIHEVLEGIRVILWPV